MGKSPVNHHFHRTFEVPAASAWAGASLASAQALRWWPSFRCSVGQGINGSKGVHHGHVGGRGNTILLKYV